MHLFSDLLLLDFIRFFLFVSYRRPGCKIQSYKPFQVLSIIDPHFQEILWISQGRTRHIFRVWGIQVQLLGVLENAHVTCCRHFALIRNTVDVTALPCSVLFLKLLSEWYSFKMKLGIPVLSLRL